MRSSLACRLSLGFVGLLASSGCAPAAQPPPRPAHTREPELQADERERVEEPASVELVSWRETSTRNVLVRFVDAVTTPDSPDYRDPSDRVAVFDLDGTLIVERPRYAMSAFAWWFYRAEAPQHPEWADTPPYSTLPSSSPSTRGEPPELPFDLVFAARAAVPEREYEELVSTFFSEVDHPRFGRSWGQTIYAPMREIVAWLEFRGFRVFVCTGSDIEFARALVESRLGIAAERVIGTTLESEVVQTQTESRLVAKPQIDTFNNEEIKVVNLERHIGRRPLLVVGNSDGDLAMMRHATSGPRPGLAMLVHHDDPERAYAYDEGAQEVLRVAHTRGWPVISMKRDFARVLEPRPPS